MSFSTPDGKQVVETLETVSNQQSGQTLDLHALQEDQIDMRVTQDTIDYAIKFQQTISNNPSLVTQTLHKWFEEIVHYNKQHQLPNDLSMSQVLSLTQHPSLPNLELSQQDKEYVVLWKLWQHYHEPNKYPAPHLKAILFYGRNSYKGQMSKDFQCQFGSENKMDLSSVNVHVPELLLRAIPTFVPVIDAFFQLHFIPFRKEFLKAMRLHCLQNEQLTSSGEGIRHEASDTFMLDLDDASLPHSDFIDSRNCYVSGKYSDAELKNKGLIK